MRIFNPFPSHIDNARLRRHLITTQLVAAPIGVIVLGYLLALELPMERIRANVWIIAFTMLAGAGGLMIFAMRLRFILAAFDLRVQRRNVWRIHVTSLFYYFFLPAGVGYDLIRAAKIGAAAQQPRAGRLAALALAERIIGGFSLLILLLLALPFTHIVESEGMRWLDPPAWVWGVCAGVVAVGILAILLYGRHRMPRLLALLPATAASILAYLVIAASLWLATEGLEIEISLAEILVSLAGTLLFQLVPVNLVGVSLGEAAAVAIYVAYGLARPDAIMLTTLAYLQRLGAAAIGGVVEARHSARWLSRNGFRE